MQQQYLQKSQRSQGVEETRRQLCQLVSEQTSEKLHQAYASNQRIWANWRFRRFYCCSRADWTLIPTLYISSTPRRKRSWEPLYSCTFVIKHPSTLYQSHQTQAKQLLERASRWMGCRQSKYLKQQQMDDSQQMAPFQHSGRLYPKHPIQTWWYQATFFTQLPSTRYTAQKTVGITRYAWHTI